MFIKERKKGFPIGVKHTGKFTYIAQIKLSKSKINYWRQNIMHWL